MVKSKNANNSAQDTEIGPNSKQNGLLRKASLGSLLRQSRSVISPTVSLGNDTTTNKYIERLRAHHDIIRQLSPEALEYLLLERTANNKKAEKNNVYNRFLLAHVLNHTSPSQQQILFLGRINYMEQFWLMFTHYSKQYSALGNGCQHGTAKHASEVSLG